jgi:hypothetical protein
LVVSKVEVDPPVDPPEDAATGVTLLLAEVADPAELVAVTVQVYAFVFVMLVTVIGLLEPVALLVVSPVAEQLPL